MISEAHEPVLGAAVGQGPMPRDAYSLLAQANLLRMRGCWAEAVEKCMAALRLAPEHPTAQSLLGDIYENQGRLDDAIQWYRMALDVQPDSPADQIKLQRLLAAKAASLPQKPASAPERAAEPESGRLPGTERRRLNPDALLRRVATFSGALVLLVVFLALAFAHSGGASLGGSQPHQLDAPAVVVPAVTAPPVQPTTGAAGPVAADPLELSLLSSLGASPSLAEGGVTLVSVQTDPRSSRLTVTAICQPTNVSGVSREAILRDATRLLQSAAQNAATASFPQFTVRCLLASPSGGSTPLVFTADASRSGIAALNPALATLSSGQIASAYSDVWWSPAVPQ